MWDYADIRQGKTAQQEKTSQQEGTAQQGRTIQQERAAQQEKTSQQERAAQQGRTSQQGRTIQQERAVQRNLQLMKLIKAVHSMVDNEDLEKHRMSQEQVGRTFGTLKEMKYEPFSIGSLPAEWVSVNRSHMKKYVVLYCHGGGYFTGSLAYARVLTNKLAQATSMDVLSFDYRLAPEHPYPAALEDALKAWDYLMYLGYGSRDVIVAGDSAGGNLALELGLQLKKQGRLLPRGFVLMSPWTDMAFRGKSHQTRRKIDPVLSGEYMERARQAYAGGLGIAWDDPRLSPLYGDLKDFPPVYIQVGGNEILLSDSVELAKRLVRENVAAKIDIYTGMWHVFQMSPFKRAGDALDKAAQFIFDICR